MKNDHMSDIVRKARVKEQKDKNEAIWDAYRAKIETGLEVAPQERFEAEAALGRFVCLEVGWEVPGAQILVETREGFRQQVIIGPIWDVYVKEYLPQFESIQRRCDVDEDTWPDEEDFPGGFFPPDYQNLREEWHKEAQRIYVRYFQQQGEPELARWWLKDQAAFCRSLDRDIERELTEILVSMDLGNLACPLGNDEEET